jgi:hypothetical protein
MRSWLRENWDVVFMLAVALVLSAGGYCAAKDANAFMRAGLHVKGANP